MQILPISTISCKSNKSRIFNSVLTQAVIKEAIDAPINSIKKTDAANIRAIYFPFGTNIEKQKINVNVFPKEIERYPYVTEATIL